MRQLKSLCESKLFQRITDSSLKAIVESAARDSAALLGTVDINMPLFTLHDERHILNVISWMETLLDVSDIQLGQFEGALCILAAYTHDLGMTLDFAERTALPKDPRFLRHRDRYPEECRLIDRLRTEGDYGRASLIESFLCMDYLRDTHAKEPAARLRKCIDQIAPDLNYKGFHFSKQLKLVAVSHNCSAEWLRGEFEKQGMLWHTPVGPDERVNFPFIGLLLRLADIMDFDASRAPAVLFRHIGLDHELTSRF